MPSMCCVVGCSKRSGRDTDVRFFHFPAVQKRTPQMLALYTERRAEWLNAIKRADLKESSLVHSRICSNHFAAGSPAHLRNELHPDWVPHLRMGYAKPINVDARLKRFARTQKGQLKKQETTSSSAPQNVLPEIIAETEAPEELSELDKLRAQLNLKDELIQKYKEKIKQLEDNLKEVTDDFESRLKEKCAEVEVKTKLLRVKGMSIDDFKDNDAKVVYFTGLPSFTVLSHLFDFVKEDITSSLTKNINVFDAFVMILLKLRLDLPLTYLAYKYCVSLKTISRIFHDNIIVFNAKMSPIVHWPDKDALRNNTPHFFSRVLGNTFTAIIDCFEIFIETPGDTLARCEVFSSYKHHSTMKYLIAISPGGAIIFVSKGYGGRCSDKTVVETSGFLNNIESGDIILSDRGMLVNKVIVERGAKLLMPAFRDGKDQIAPGDIERTRNLTKVRIHVERVIGLLRQKYLILTNRQPITATSKVNGDEMYFDYIVKSCCALVNLSPSVINIDK